MQPKWTAVISTGRFSQISLYTTYEGSNFCVPYMFLANYIEQSGKFSSFYEFWLLKSPKIRSLGLGIEFWDFFWDLVVPNMFPVWVFFWRWANQRGPSTKTTLDAPLTSHIYLIQLNRKDPCSSASQISNPPNLVFFSSVTQLEH